MSTTGMMQRCWTHDYCAPSFYMITIVTEPRRGCLSVLAGTASDPLLQLSPIGEVVREVWQRTSAVYPGVEGCECVVMPDHFHGILWVKERLARPMGHIVKAFKRVSTQECRSRGLLLPPDPSRGLLLPPDPSLVPAAGQVLVPAAAPAAGCSTLWQEGFQDSILLRKGQLKAMVNYIADNPRRLLAKRAHPELFTVVAEQQLGPELACPVVGNRDLLHHPLKRQVQISRRSDKVIRNRFLAYPGRHRPGGAEIMSEPVWSSEFMVPTCQKSGEMSIAPSTRDFGAAGGYPGVSVRPTTPTAARSPRQDQAGVW